MSSLLHLAAIVVFVVVGVLLLVGSITVAHALAFVCFGLAAWAAVTVAWPRVVT